MTTPTDIHEVEYSHTLVGLQLKDKAGHIYDVLETSGCKDFSSKLLSAPDVTGVVCQRQSDGVKQTLSLNLLKQCEAEILSETKKSIPKKRVHTKAV